jgi:hypothetical protein
VARRISSVAAKLPTSNAVMSADSGRSGLMSTGRTRIRNGLRSPLVGVVVWRSA